MYREEGGSRKSAFINPQITHIEGEQTGEEGCLSFPGLYQAVKREMRVIIRAQDLNGEQLNMILKTSPRGAFFTRPTTATASSFWIE